MENLPINITHIPFSRYGAYISVTLTEGEKELIIHNVQRRFDESPTLRLRFGETGTSDFEVFAKPSHILVKADEGEAKIYIQDDWTLALSSKNLNVLWQMIPQNGYGIEEDKQHFRMVSVDQKVYLTFWVEKGKALMNGPMETFYKNIRNKKQNLFASCDNHELRMSVHINRKEPQRLEKPILPDAEIAAIDKQWMAFLRKMPETNTKDTISKTFEKITWYNIWSSFVRAEDVYHHDTMMMSKKAMTSVWSWDHCFNALMMSNIGKQEAMDQFEAPFFLQSEKGALPDCWNPHTEAIWGIMKPPIHGWCFSKLMKKFSFSPEELTTVYQYLEKWTNWWMNENDCDHNGIPEYPQGCDSGWDNSTVFDTSYYVESPDLPAYLILQMKTLSDIAGKLKKGKNDIWSERQNYWENKSEKLKSRFYEDLWNGERFRIRFANSKETIENPTSLISMMPIVLGEHLDSEKKEKLIHILKRDFLTENGLATEMPTSTLYESDGYWRGPIWAPTTYLLVDGLKRCGEEALATEIAKKYCRMSARLAKGNYENFDALTGKGLRAPGYTWSASVYLMLSWEYRNLN